LGRANAVGRLASPPGRPGMAGGLRIDEPGEVPVSREVTEPEGPLTRPSAAASVARGPVRLPARASQRGQMLADLGTHHGIEALVPEGQRACVPSHERDAGAARTRCLRRRPHRVEPVEAAPPAGKPPGVPTRCPRRSRRPVCGEGVLKRPIPALGEGRAPPRCRMAGFLDGSFPLASAPLRVRGQSSRRRIETSSVRVW
jgi:hypothetical protein